MNFIAKRIHWIGIVLLAGFTALAAGLYFDAPARTARPANARAATAAPGAIAAGKYLCPMHPEVSQPGPGECPQCGMALVPAGQAAAAGCSAGEDHSCCSSDTTPQLKLPPGHPPIPAGLVPPGCPMMAAPANSTNSCPP